MYYQSILFIGALTIAMFVAIANEQQCVSPENIITTTCTTKIAVTGTQTINMKKGYPENSFQYHYIMRIKVGNYGNLTQTVQKSSSEYYPDKISTSTETCYIVNYKGKITNQNLFHKKPPECGPSYMFVLILTPFLAFIIFIFPLGYP